MGTSLSQSSPRITNWNRVLSCYKNSTYPESRVINEIWRALENQEIPISRYLKSESIYSIYSTIRGTNNYDEALSQITNHILDIKNNSFIVELAKRVLPICYESHIPEKQWKNSFFSQITLYVVSRDVSGFVGKKYRNKSIDELVNYKESISNKVKMIVEQDTKILESKREWNRYVSNIISRLKDI